MKKSRFFVVLFCSVTGLFLLTNFVVWNVWVEDLRTNKYAGGDLARMGYLSDIKMPRTFRNNLAVRHLELDEYRGEKIDVLTLGDSFSNPTELGENVYYQDHLATLHNLRVLNILPHQQGMQQPQTDLIKLFNIGELDRIKPRFVLLESVERYAIQRLGKKLDFGLTATPDELKCWAIVKDKVLYRPRLFDFITTANTKYLYNNLLYRFTDHSSDKSVYIARLQQNFFSTPEGNLLAYLGEDTTKIKDATPAAVTRLNNNLNILAQMLAEKGMTLIFMPVVDKYNLYRDYLADDGNMKKSRFFEELRPLDKRYIFIDTKALLADELAKGEKDVFFADDTHWSDKAGSAIFSSFVLH